MTTLLMRLSGKTQVLQNMGEQLWEQEWNGLGSVEILFVDLLLEVKQRFHNKILWAKPEVLKDTEYNLKDSASPLYDML